MPLHQALTYIKKNVEEILNAPNVDVYLDSIGKDDVKEGVYVSLLYAEEEKTLKNNDYLLRKGKSKQSRGIPQGESQAVSESICAYSFFLHSLRRGVEAYFLHHCRFQTEKRIRPI